MSRAISPERKLERLAQCARGVLSLVYTPDCCIAATRAGLAVLERLRIKGQPRAVLACAMNAEWLAGVRELPAWMLAVDPDETIKPNHFGGHLVIVGKVGSRKFLLDMSAAQFNRPARGIHVSGAVLVALRHPLPLASPWGVSVNLLHGGLLGYCQHPNEQAATWKDAPDWTMPGEWHKRTHSAAVEQLMIEIERTTR